jgi:hypothetical protein
MTPGHDVGDQEQPGFLKSTYTRRGVLGIAALGALAACSSKAKSTGAASTSASTSTSGGASTSAAATTSAGSGGGAGKTVKIGVMRPATGVFASNGKDMEAGRNLYGSRTAARSTARSWSSASPIRLASPTAV